MKITQNVSVLAALFSLCSAAALPAPPAKPFSLYAYGQNISGLPLFISGDVAYVGHPNSLPSSLNVTFTLSDEGVLGASANTTETNVTLASSARLYIITTDDSLKAVGIANSTSSVPDGGVASSFGFYGNMFVNIDSSGNVLSSFWATQSSQSGVWNLVWNVNGSGHDYSTPVVLKTTAPVIIS